MNPAFTIASIISSAVGQDAIDLEAVKDIAVYCDGFESSRDRARRLMAMIDPDHPHYAALQSIRSGDDSEFADRFLDSIQEEIVTTYHQNLDGDCDWGEMFNLRDRGGS